LLYAVMEYAEEDLAKVLMQRPLTEQELRETIVPLLEGLEYLHRAGFAHGRLKPSNILGADDRVKLSCDGILRIGEPAGAWRPGNYDAPEAGEAAVTAAWDLWPLGMVTVEALTQRPPAWSGKRLMLPETLPAPFRDLACQCLQEDSQLRWSTWQIMESLSERPRSPAAAAGEEWSGRRQQANVGPPVKQERNRKFL
jgi:serine/threonine protein kinase